MDDLFMLAAPTLVICAAGIPLRTQPVHKHKEERLDEEVEKQTRKPGDDGPHQGPRSLN